MNKKELSKILAEHLLWLAEKGGTRANLCGADLCGADLRDADLRGVNLRDVNLCGADLRGVNLRGADLRGVNLRDVNLCGADLRGVNLRDVNLCGADLRGADLRGADLRGVNLRDVNLCGAALRGADLRDADLRGVNLRGVNLRDVNLCGADLRGADLRDADLRGVNLRGVKNISKLTASKLSIVPQVGAFVAWKKLQDGLIAKLMIPEDAKRSNATGRKCRAERAVVLEISGGKTEGISLRGETKYVVGQTVECDMWCEDRWKECAGGIHFFITKEEAEAYEG